MVLGGNCSPFVPCPGESSPPFRTKVKNVKLPDGTVQMVNQSLEPDAAAGEGGTWLRSPF